jgi:hypothetical protein
MPNVQPDEEMHIELHLVIMNRGCEIKDLKPEDAIQLVTGYSLAAIVKTCKIGGAPEQTDNVRGTFVLSSTFGWQLIIGQRSKLSVPLGR